MRNPAIIWLLLIAALCSAQSPAPVETTATYHSDAMGLDFVYPSGFVNKTTAGSVATKEQGQALKEKKAADGCVTFPITAMDMRKAFNMIFLKRSDTACLATETTAADRGIATVNFLTVLLREFGKPTTSSITDYTIGSHVASAVSGSVKVQGDAANTVIYGAASCLVASRNLACFAFLSSDCQTLLVLSDSKVKFADTAPTPVVPAKLLPACKLRS